MSGYPIYVPKPVWLDSNGAPIVNGQVEFFESGTSTRAAIFSDIALTTPATNPVTLNARGEPATAIYVPYDTPLKVAVRDALGATVYTIDPFQLGSGVTAANVGLALYPRTAEEIAAGVTPTLYTYPVGWPQRYGAVTGGSTDCSSAIQSAINVCRNTGIPLVLEGGDFRINSQLIFRAASTGSKCRLHVRQGRNARLVSYVTGAIDGFNTAGFAILMDGYSDSTWENLALDFANGTAGIVSRVRYAESIANHFPGARITGGAATTDRQTRTKIAVRYIGNESASGSTAYANYFDRWTAPYFNIAHVCFDMVVGDGSASTRQPNCLYVVSPQFSRYMTACRLSDTDEHNIMGAFAHMSTGVSLGTVSSVTQAAGVATVTTAAAHGLEVGDIVIIAGASPSAYNGIKKVATVPTTTTFTFSIDSGTSSPATGTITANWASIVWRGETTLSQFSGNLEPGANSLPYYLDDSASGGGSNLLMLVNNTGSRGVVEDTTEKSTIIDRYFIEWSGQGELRIDGSTVATLGAALNTFTEPSQAPSFNGAKLDVASATNITYTAEASVYRITGTTTINTITAPPAGSAPEITLIFTASLTVNDDGTSAGNLRLAGGTNFTATADDVLKLVWNSTDSKWHEVCRSVN